MNYNADNIFAKILRKEIPCDKVFENEYVLAFNDVAPQAPIHILLIPKKPYLDMNDFTSRASVEEIGALFKAVGDIAKEAGVDQSGYRMISNCRKDSGQEVPHLHIHILAGTFLGPMLSL